MSKKGDDDRSTQSKSKYDQDFEKRMDTRKDYISGRGPVGLIILKIMDSMVWVIKRIFQFLWYDLVMPTFNFTYNLLFSEFHGIFAGKDKDGDCYNSSIFRYILTIIVPPMGIFMSKGLVGWHNIIICIVLTFFHIFPGIIYAFVVTHTNRYADRYQQRELEKIEELKARRGNTAEEYGMGGLLLGIGVLVGMVYILVLIARLISKLSKN